MAGELETGDLWDNKKYMNTQEQFTYFYPQRQTSSLIQQLESYPALTKLINNKAVPIA